jgi:hypothetical protein
MKLIQISPRQLICEDDTFQQNMTSWRILSISMGIFAVAAIFETNTNPRRMAYNILYILVIYLAFSIGFAVVSHYTATIDLDLECIEIKQYWPLFRKRQIKQYQIDLITHIEVQSNNSGNYQVFWKQHNCSVQFGGGYTEDRSQAESDAEIIRSFLNQDGRDIEIG